MLGALDGLHTMLKQQLSKDDLSSADSTYITMTTDGRPERRSWWDNVDGENNGVAIPLPESLGGDSITASGLLYNSDGDWRYVPDNVRQWLKSRAQ